jgi:hypothetical protein
VDRFIKAVAPATNTFVHCALGSRAAALWMIKRVKVDHWTQTAALEEANALGLTDRLRPFVMIPRQMTWKRKTLKRKSQSVLRFAITTLRFERKDSEVF